MVPLTGALGLGDIAHQLRTSQPEPERQVTILEVAPACREAEGPGEFLGRQSKKVGEHCSRHFCETSNLLPISSCAFSSSAPTLSPV